MRTITAPELKKILADHKTWRESGGSSGARADLAGADLAGAYLAGAYLADAYLADAYLAGAYLADAYLAGADLAGAYLAGADLAGADLAGAYLADAYLAGAYLAGADLAGADLADANLSGAYLAGAYLAGAKNVPTGTPADPTAPRKTRTEWEAQRATSDIERAKRFRAAHPEVPVIEALDAKILEAIEGGGELQMGSWHSCKTTHCRGGWAITLAGKPGAALEKEIGVERAAAAIYRASTGRAPHFYATNEAALADIKARAAEQSS